MIRSTGIQKQAQTPCREHRLASFPITGFVPIAGPKKKILKTLTERIKEK